MSRLIGLHQVLRELNRGAQEYRKNTRKGVYRASIPIRRKAVRLAPVVTGNLRNSAYTILSWAGVEHGSSATFSGENATEMGSDHQSVLSQRSAAIQGVSEPTAEIGFTALYAVMVHENPRAGQTGGESPSGVPYPRTKTGRPTWSEKGQWKFLEQAIKDNKDQVLQILAQEARRRR